MQNGKRVIKILHLELSYELETVSLKSAENNLVVTIVPCQKVIEKELRSPLKVLSPCRMIRFQDVLVIELVKVLGKFGQQEREHKVRHAG